jgi:HlyD family secretion protein
MASNPKSSSSTKLVIWGVALIVLVVAVFAVRSLTRQRVAVHIVQVTIGDVISTNSTTGRVEAIHDFQAHAVGAGQVQAIYVGVGEQVKAGQLLLKMDDQYALASLAHAESSLRTAEAQVGDIEHGGTQDERNIFAADLSRAQIQLQQDQATLATRQNLQREGAASAAEVAEAQRSIELDQNNIHSIEQRSTQRYGQGDRTRAEAEVADAKAAVAAAQSGYNNVDIRSKISGTVYYLPVSQYDYVSTDPDHNDLVYVADLKHLQITGYFDEPEIGSLAAGQPVRIVWDAKPGTTWHGHVTQAPTTIIAYGNRNVGECFITVDDADGVLQPNANVTVYVTTAQDLNVLRIPREALHFDGAQAYVYRVVSRKLARTLVKSGIINSNWAEVKSGLAEGDTIAGTPVGTRDLSDGLEVTPIQ